MRLSDVCAFRRGKSITQKDIKCGSIPVIAGGRKPAYYHNEYNREGESITISSSGAYAGFVSYWNEPIFCSDCFTVDSLNTSVLSTKYLYHYLASKQDVIFSKKKGSGVPHVHGSDMADMLIPVPSIEEQMYTVSVLDRFEKLCNSLENGIPAEITARKRQYEYYRNKLLTFK